MSSQKRIVSHSDLERNRDRAETMLFILSLSTLITIVLTFGTLLYATTIGTTFSTAGLIGVVSLPFLFAFASQVAWKLRDGEL
jgi:hypothetical protein